MAYPTLDYNSSTGSDTAPSDSANTSADSGATASGSASGTTITFSSSVDLSACADDDSDWMWCETTTGGIHLFRITAFTTATDLTAVTAVTVEPAITANFSGAAWHVNGTRQTIHVDSPDWRRGWTAVIDGTFTANATFTPCLNDTATAAVDDLPFTLRASSSASSRPVITDSDSSRRIIYSNLRTMLKFTGVKFEATGSGGSNQNISLSAAVVSFVDCVIVNNATTQPTYWIDIQRGVRLSDCYVSGGSSRTIDTQFNTHVLIDNCWFDGKGTLASSSLVHLEGFDNVVTNTLVTDGAGVGIDFDIDGATQEFWFCKNNTVYGCSSHGIALTGTPGTTTQPRHTFYVVNNLVVGNGGYGINMPQTSLSVETFDIDFNCVFNNTSGGYNGPSPGANDVTITSDPFTDTASDDYTLNSSSTGGALLKDAARYDLPDGT